MDVIFNHPWHHDVNPSISRARNILQTQRKRSEANLAKEEVLHAAFQGSIIPKEESESVRQIDGKKGAAAAVDYQPLVVIWT